VDILCFRYGILPGRLVDKLVVKGLVNYVDWDAAGVKDTLGIFCNRQLQFAHEGCDKTILEKKCPNMSMCDVK